MTVSSLQWESLYWLDSAFILNQCTWHLILDTVLIKNYTHVHPLIIIHSWISIVNSHTTCMHKRSLHSAATLAGQRCLGGTYSLYLLYGMCQYATWWPPFNRHIKAHLIPRAGIGQPQDQQQHVWMHRCWFFVFHILQTWFFAVKLL